MKERIVKLKEDIGFISYSAVGGYEEKRGPLGDKFDICDPSDKFSQRTFEEAEGEMSRIALNTALSKINISHSDLSVVVAGDLQNQCVASSGGLSSFGVPYIGLYGACSTCTEGLIVLSSLLLSSNYYKKGAIVTGSHNAAAEKQFRMPIEYGGVRAPSAQWTATAAGAFILSKGEGEVKIKEFMPGKIVDGETTDATNMGAAMAFSTADTIISYFEESGLSPEIFDYIVTGDLGKVGSSILGDILSEKNPRAQRRHIDCGMLLYDFKNQDCHSGASGCGTSASVLAAEFLPSIKRGEIGDILFLSTGALMSPLSVLHGNNILGISPLIRIGRDIK